MTAEDWNEEELAAINAVKRLRAERDALRACIEEARDCLLEEMAGTALEVSITAVRAALGGDPDV